MIREIAFQFAALISLAAFVTTLLAWVTAAFTSSSKPCPQVRLSRVNRLLRPTGCVRPAGVSPVPVGTGAPGSRPQFVGEIWRAERGVESLFGGSKIAGRSVKRTLQPRHSDNGRAEPLMSRRRPCPVGPGPGFACRVSPG